MKKQDMSEGVAGGMMVGKLEICEEKTTQKGTDMYICTVGKIPVTAFGKFCSVVKKFNGRMVACSFAVRVNVVSSGSFVNLSIDSVSELS